MNSVKKTLSIVQPAIPHYRRFLFEAIAAEGHTLHYILIGEPSTSRWENAKLYLGSLRHLHGKWSELKASDRILLVGNIKYLLVPMIMLLFPSKTYILTHSNSATSGFFGFFLRMLLARFCRKIIFYMKEEHELLRSCLPSSDYLDNSVGIPFRPNTGESQAQSQEAQVFFIGRITAKVRLQTLIDVASSMKKHAEFAVFHVMGFEVSQLESFRKLLEVHSVQDYFRLYPSTTDKSLIEAVARQCQVAIYPGAVGLSIHTYASLGLSCIVPSTQKHMPEILPFLTSSFSYSDIESLRRLLTIDCKERCDHMGTMASFIYKARFAPMQTVENLRRSMDL
jgi:glycosyltransferase involved in cell wall biosynthesis